MAHKSKGQLDEILNEMLIVSRKDFIKSCQEILSYPVISEWYPGLTVEFAVKVFDALPRDSFVKITKWISTNPENRNGWPDLNIVKDGVVSFIEVKTSDNLHRSQLITIAALKELAVGDVKVLKLFKDKQSNAVTETARLI